MRSQERSPRIMVTCAGRIPSVELAAIIPFTELQKRKQCIYEYRDESSLTFQDIMWCDILFVMRGVSNISLWAAIQAKKYGRLVMGYWDDDFLSIPSDNPNFGYYSSQEIKNNINKLFKLIDVFFSPNPLLASKLTSLNGRQAKILPGVCGTEFLQRPMQRNNNPLIIGFAGTSVNIGQMNTLLGPSLAKVAAENINFKVHIIGPKPNFIGDLPVETIHTDFMTNYYQYLNFAAKLSWDIGLAPQVDCEFTTHKYYNKLLEYTHIGCAGIYSKLEPYNSVIQDSITGLLVDNEIEAWKEAILRLLRDSELRSRIANNSFEYVQSHHSRDAVATGYYIALSPFLKYRAPSVSK